MLQETIDLLQSLAGARPSYRPYYSEALDLTLCRVAVRYDVSGVTSTILDDISAELVKFGASHSIFSKLEPVYIRLDQYWFGENELAIGIVMPTTAHPDRINLILGVEGNHTSQVKSLVQMWEGFGLAKKAGLNPQLVDWINIWKDHPAD